MSTDPSLICPQCGASIKLTESLAAPLIAATRAQYEQQLRNQAAQFAAEKEAVTAREQENHRRAAELDLAAKGVEQRVALAVQKRVEQQLSRDRKLISEQESTRARQQVELELNAKQAEAAQQAERIEKLTHKLTAAQRAEADLLKQKRELEDKERELALNLQKGIAAGLQEVRAKALCDAQANVDLKMQDRDNVITQLRDQITNLQRKAEQGSQQAQGESLELLLENQLRAQFPFDLFEPVAKGEFGGDILQHVRDQAGQLCGKILWESKRTKAWSDAWLPKLKNDQLTAHAELAILVSQTMPKDITHFKQIEGVWVCSLSCVIAVAGALRISLIELAALRRCGEGQETKAQQIYSYLIGPQFKHRVECIAEKFTELRKDLDAERKWMNKQWAKRDRELNAVLEATAGMYGDLQGIAGQSLEEIRSLQGPMVPELRAAG